MSIFSRNNIKMLSGILLLFCCSFIFGETPDKIFENAWKKQGSDFKEVLLEGDKVSSINFFVKLNDKLKLATLNFSSAMELELYLYLYEPDTNKYTLLKENKFLDGKALNEILDYINKGYKALNIDLTVGY
ncbi:MAG: hypothetical protein IKX23_11580 [Treponema sp.]|nr:hypothetical protein [Treponema sp.]